MSLDYRKLYVEAYITLLLAQVTFVHTDALSLIHQKQYSTLGEKSNTWVIISSWCFYGDTGDSQHVCAWYHLKPFRSFKKSSILLC